MKISEFAKKFDKKKSTIRHYTEMKLLLPSYIGAYPDYDQQCEVDMTSILFFIDLGFSLDDILLLKTYERLMISLPQERIIPVKNLIDLHIDETQDAIKNLKKRMNALENYKNQLIEQSKKESSIGGSSLSMLDILACPKCGQAFHINDMMSRENIIMSGTFHCDCGEHYEFVDGILIPSNYPTEVMPTNDYSDLNNLRKTISPELMSAVTRSGEQLHQEISQLANHTNMLFIAADTDIMMFDLDSAFREDGRYIFQGVQYDNIKWLKNHLSNHHAKGQFLFIACDQSLPLKAEVNHIVDMSSTAMEYLLQLPHHSLLEDSFTKMPQGDFFSMFIGNSTIQCDHESYQYLSKLPLKEFLYGHKTQVINEVDIIQFEKTPNLFPNLDIKDLTISLILGKKE